MSGTQQGSAEDVIACIDCMRQAEAERLIFEDADPHLGFVLHPDMKWVRTALIKVPRMTFDISNMPGQLMARVLPLPAAIQDQVQLESLYCIAIAHR